MQQLFQGFPSMLLPSGTDGMGKVRLVGLLKAIPSAKVDLKLNQPKRVENLPALTNHLSSDFEIQHSAKLRVILHLSPMQASSLEARI